MASLYLKSTTTLLLIITTLSITIAEIEIEIFDSEGKELVNGGRYYIIPQNPSFSGSGLSPTFKNDTMKCPYYITQFENETSLGVPVRMSSTIAGSSTILKGAPTTFEFEKKPENCKDRLGWKVVRDEKKGESYVTLSGSDFWAFNLTKSFVIGGTNGGVYRLFSLSEDKFVGLIEKDGFLGINDANPLSVVFKRYIDKGLVMNA